MPRATNPNTIRKHKDAIDFFNKLASKREVINGVKYKVHPNEYCIAKAAFKFYMSPKTLEDVLFRK